MRTNKLECIRYQVARMACLAIAVLFLCGCESVHPKPLPSLLGTFSGVSPDGTPIKVTFQQKGNRVAGGGTIGDKAISLSAITAWHGPVMMILSDGRTIFSNITLSPDGTTVTINGFGSPMVLRQENPAAYFTSGLFSGRYSGKAGPQPLRLKLFQDENLIAGTGVLSGTTFAYVGKTIGDRQSAGTVMLSDESKVRTILTLSDDNQALSVTGLGDQINLARD